MRFVIRDLSDVPDIFKKESVLADIEKIARGAVELINDSIYKGTYKDNLGKSQSSVRDKLNIYYLKKCAYCETFCKAEIEHYRPKKGVYEDLQHTGYYWLCYEWSNLIPSCRYCNTEGGKGTKFPINGERVYKPAFIGGKLEKLKCKAGESPLIKEDPFLIHPEVENPKKHLAFCWDDENRGIKLREKNQSERGRRTIDICNLNRDYLLVDRLKAVLHPIRQHLTLLFEYLEKGLFTHDNAIFDALFIYFAQLDLQTQDFSLPHTYLRQYIMGGYIAFAEIVGPYIINPNQRSIVLEAFRAYEYSK